MVLSVRPYRDTHTTTYDLTIPDLHTYYVSAGLLPVLVHNVDEDNLCKLTLGPPLTGQVAEGVAAERGDKVLPHEQQMINEFGDRNGCTACRALTIQGTRMDIGRAITTLPTSLTRMDHGLFTRTVAYARANKVALLTQFFEDGMLSFQSLSSVAEDRVYGGGLARFAHGLLVVASSDSVDSHDSWDPGQESVHAGTDSLYVSVVPAATGYVTVICISGPYVPEGANLLFSGTMRLSTENIAIYDPNGEIRLELPVNGNVHKVDLYGDDPDEPAEIIIVLNPVSPAP